jgi:hypothetical protein
MTRAFAYLTTTMLIAAYGCDPERGAPDHSAEFRQTITYVQMHTQTASFRSLSVKACDPPLDALQLGEEEWEAMLHAQAEMIANNMLLTAFLGHPDTEILCRDSCADVQRTWSGGAYITHASYNFGEVQITGECPYDMVETSIPTEAEAEFDCECR